MDRKTKIERTVRKAYADGKTRSEARKLLGAKLGEDPATLHGTSDPVYLRAVAEASPLEVADAKTPDGKLGALARALAKRRNAGGDLARRDTLRYAASAYLGRPVSDTVLRALLERGKVDLATSYLGRGTRVAAKGTYGAPLAEIESATK